MTAMDKYKITHNSQMSNGLNVCFQNEIDTFYNNLNYTYPLVRYTFVSSIENPKDMSKLLFFIQSIYMVTGDCQ